MPKIKPAKNQMLNKCKRDLSCKYINTQEVMKYIYKKKPRRKVNTVTVPKLFKTPKFQNRMFFLH